jgi:hypothetical protein
MRFVLVLLAIIAAALAAPQYDRNYSSRGGRYQDRDDNSPSGLFYKLDENVFF